MNFAQRESTAPIICQSALIFILNIALRNRGTSLLNVMTKVSANQMMYTVQMLLEVSLILKGVLARASINVTLLRLKS